MGKMELTLPLAMIKKKDDCETRLNEMISSFSFDCFSSDSTYKALKRYGCNDNTGDSQRICFVPPHLSSSSLFCHTLELLLQFGYVGRYSLCWDICDHNKLPPQEYESWQLHQTYRSKKYKKLYQTVSFLTVTCLLTSFAHLFAALLCYLHEQCKLVFHQHDRIIFLLFKQNRHLIE